MEKHGYVFISQCTYVICAQFFLHVWFPDLGLATARRLFVFPYLWEDKPAKSIKKKYYLISYFELVFVIVGSQPHNNF